MKTSILTIAAVLTLGLTAVKSANAESRKNDVSTVLTDIRQINKIEVHGNVELYISSATTDQVKVYNQYYAERALVQNQNGVLRISSYSNEKLVVWVSAADLRSITAYDNAEVKSFGTFSAIDLEVNLKDNALANLDLDAYSASINVNDRAKANLAGTATICDVKFDHSSTVNSSNLAAGKVLRSKSNSVLNGNELATL